MVDLARQPGLNSGPRFLPQLRDRLRLASRPNSLCYILPTSWTNDLYYVSCVIVPTVRSRPWREARGKLARACLSHFRHFVRHYRYEYYTAIFLEVRFLRFWFLASLAIIVDMT